MKIFVYGTLKTGHERNGALHGQKFLGEFKTQPHYKLFRVSSFPGLVPATSDPCEIHGEVWEVDEDCLRQLDRIEGHPSLFCRKEILVEGQNDCFAYFWQGSVDGAKDMGNRW